MFGWKAFQRHCEDLKLASRERGGIDGEARDYAQSFHW
jgi:hypothetical protein